MWKQCSLWISHNLDWQREEKFVIQPHNTGLLWIDEQLYRSTWSQCFVQTSHDRDQQHGNKHLCSNLTIISLYISMNNFKLESKNLWNNSNTHYAQCCTSMFSHKTLLGRCTMKCKKWLNLVTCNGVPKWLFASSIFPDSTTFCQLAPLNTPT